ncbi:MAG: tetratricopeptide repeat protein, partial [Deltaproteobacteria bacterium]|nr:tetratricopeptide repeat protein [Deltaproteobacteria bacterium]
LSASLLDWRVLGSLAILSGISLLAWRDIKKQSYLAFGWLWLVTGLLPVSNLLPLTAILAERFLYLPLMGFAVWAGYLWSRLENRKLAAAILFLALTAMMTLSIRRNLEWQDPFRFWTTEVSRSPNSYIAHDYLGNLYYQNGDLPSAERHLLRAEELDPTYFNSLHGLSLVYAKWEKYDQAIVYARKNLSFDPASPDAYITLGISYGGKGDLLRAEEAFKQAVSIDPESKEGWTDLGVIYSQQQMWAKAAEAYSKALATDPGDPGSYNGLALSLIRTGSENKAVEFWQKALALNPDHLESRMNLAQALEKNDPAGAAAQWEIFLQAAQKLGQPVNREFIGRRIEALKKNEKKKSP